MARAVRTRAAEQRTAWTALLCSVLVGGCASIEPHQQGDRGPGQAVDLSHLVEPVPYPLPRSRYGNPESYEVFGQRYHVMSEVQDGYTERGKASWYGKKFHGRPTSSQEPYDMYALTAAHKTLPLPSWVRVTHLETGRSTVVKVNDRGPFVDGRIIDLSWAAASRLGIVDSGIAPVEIRVIVPEPPESDALAAAPPVPAEPQITAEEHSAAGYAIYVQVGAFAEQDNASQLLARLRATLPEYGARIEVPGGAGLYRVRLGPVGDETEAQQITLRLSAQGFAEAHIVRDAVGVENLADADRPL